MKMNLLVFFNTSVKELNKPYYNLTNNKLENSFKAGVMSVFTYFYNNILNVKTM